MRRPSTKLLLIVLAAILLAAILLHSRHSITLQGFSWTLMGASLRQARFSLLLLSVVTIYACYAIRALRWARLSRYLGCPSFTGVYAATLMGFTVLVLLGRVAEPVRPLLISRKESLPVPGTFGIYALERLLDITSTAIFAGLALLLATRLGATAPAALPLLAIARKTGIVLLACVCAAILFLSYLRSHGAGWILARLSSGAAPSISRTRLASLFQGFHDGLQAIRTFSDLAWAIGLTAVHWFLVWILYLWIPWSFGGQLATINAGGALLLMTLTLVGSTLQLPGVGGGSQLASFLVLSVILGVTKERAAAAAIAIWLVTFVSCAIVGLPLLIREGLSVKELRSMARAERAAEAAGAHISASEEIVLVLPQPPPPAHLAPSAGNPAAPERRP
jgi:uncharacterized membrane protein YbhN (UPF0104 family)